MRLFSAASLTYLMEQCQSLKALKVENQPLTKITGIVLESFSKPGLEIELKNAKSQAIPQYWRSLKAIRDRLSDRCYMDSSVL
jgi:hypothetical protein